MQPKNRVTTYNPLIIHEFMCVGNGMHLGKDWCLGFYFVKIQFDGTLGTLPRRVLDFEPNSDGRHSWAQNSNISDRLEKNAFLTIRPISVISINGGGCRSTGCMFDIRPFYNIGILSVMIHNLLFSLAEHAAETDWICCGLQKNCFIALKRHFWGEKHTFKKKRRPISYSQKTA